MGTSTWSTDKWTGYSASIKTKSTEEIFRSRSINSDLDPKGINRESRDSEFNPESTPVIVACDVTGSMGQIADNLIRKGLGTLFEEILERKPVTDPHVMAMGIGDVHYDSAPLQVTQFEADITIAEQLEQVFIEGGGGGNSFESYDMPMYFAAYHTSHDAFEKRGKKGYLFTIGDEPAPPYTSAKGIVEFIGDDVQENIPTVDVANAAKKMYNVYHIIIAEGYYAGMDLAGVKESWYKVLGPQNVIVLTDYTKLAEVIVSIMEVNEGAEKETVVASWSGETSLVVQNAVSDMAKAEEAFDAANGGVTRF